MASDTVKIIPLTQGQFALVDSKDFDWLNQWKWYAQKSYITFYACRCVRPKPGKPERIAMHRLIMKAPQDLQVDHINHNGIDNQRLNLRLCTGLENQWNARNRVGASRFKGVSRCNHYWKAQINVNKQRISLGYLLDEKDAARAYDIAALKYFGGFAKTNKMLGLFNEA